MNGATVDAALKALRDRIAAGEEYPDAQWRVSQQFKVPGDVLQDAYDRQEGAHERQEDA